MMAIGDKLTREAARYMQPGEEIQAVFLAKRLSMEYNDRAVVVTDRRLLLLKLNFFQKPTAVLAEAGRNTRLGPWRGRLMYDLPVFGGNLQVHRRFRGDVDEADRTAGLHAGPHDQGG